jgi:hypothetical protein
MKSLHPRTHFFVALVLLLALCAHARGQAKPGAPVITPPPKPAPLPTRPGPIILADPVVQSEWREFKSEAGSFKVKFPGTPKLSQTPFQKGPLSLTRQSHTVAFGGSQFEVDYVDTPAGYLEPDLSLEGGISGMINAMTGKGARLLTKESVARGNCEGREATLALPNPGGHKDGFAQGRIFTSGQRFYILMFVGMEDSVRTRETAKTFMESFTVEGGCTAALAPTTAPPARKIVSNVEGTPDASTGWRKIEDSELGFSVLMPGRAQHESELAQVEPFPVTHHTYINEGDTEVYSAEVFGEYPPNFNSRPESFQTMIDVTLYAVKKNFEPVGFTLTPLRDLRVGSYPGREFSVVNEKAGARGRMQIYATPKHIYIFTSFTRATTPGATTLLERFFTSVRVSPK